MFKAESVFDKTLYVGMFILDLSKTVMCDFMHKCLTNPPSPCHIAIHEQRQQIYETKCDVLTFTVFHLKKKTFRSS